MYEPAELRTRMLTDVKSAIERKMSLPGYWYADADVHRFEQDHVIRSSWQPVGSIEKLAEPGDYLTAVVADAPVLIVRGDDGRLRAFLNMCRHRGHPVAEGCGNKKLITCPFHGWTYRRDGTLLRATRADREAGFAAEKYPLRPIRLGVWGPIAFVNMEPAGPDFDVEMATLFRVTEENGFNLANMTYRKRLAWDQAGNWKVFIDNSADCYHCRLVHPGMGKTHKTDPDEYETTSYDTFVLHVSHPREDHPNMPAWMMCAAWPNWAVSAAQGRVARLRWTEPLDANRIRVITDFCAPPSVSDEEVEEDARWYDKLVNTEDRSVCEGVALNHAGRTFTEGPVFLESESVVQDFQKRYQRWLEAMPAPLA